MALPRLDKNSQWEKLSSVYDNKEVLNISMPIMEKVMQEAHQQGISRQQLADLLGVRKVYITQLCTGSKLVSLLQLTKFQQVLDIEFEIVIKK
jgi:predicted XRE-type DNA-binding protein